MRKAHLFGMTEDAAFAFLAAAPVVHLASVRDDGAPLLRTVNAVVEGGAVCFHGAPAGEKTEAIGREVVIAAEEIVASIPSWFIDPERACPATTLYRSVQAHGVLETIDEPAAKARVQGGEDVAGDDVMCIPRAGHRVHDAGQVLVLDGRCKLSLTGVLHGHEVEFFGGAHAASLPRPV